MLRVGLTGGIACGKSHVLRRIAASGLATLDLDAVAHDLVAPGGAAYEELVAAFGREILAGDGAIDRKALGGVVFADPGARARIDALLHPRVRAEEARRAAALEAEGCPVLVSDGALLVEAGAHLRFDRLVVVHCAPEEQLRRLILRDGIPEAAARARIEAQMPVAEKRLYAHAEVETSGTVAETEATADAVARQMVALAGRERHCVETEDRRVRTALAQGPGPRGLAGDVLLEDALAAGGLELARLAGRLQPPVVGPWYRAARDGEKAPWPEALAVSLAVWASRAGFDEEWLAAAAASLARLTHAVAGSIADACLAALVAKDAVARRDLDGTRSRLAGWARLATRWGGASPAGRVAQALSAANAHPNDPAAARRAAEASGAEPAFAGGLVALLSRTILLSKPHGR